MQKFDADLLAKNLNQLADVFDRKPVSGPALQAWFDSLKEFPTERVMGVLIGWPRAHLKFPTPSEVWKLCNEIGIGERERKADLEKREQIEWERSPAGEKFLAKMREIINRPSRTPKEHWEHVLRTQPPGSIGHEYAKKILKPEEREPGQDDEPQAVNF